MSTEPTIHDLYECRYEPDKLIVLIERMHNKFLHTSKTRKEILLCIYTGFCLAKKEGVCLDMHYCNCQSKAPIDFPK